MIEKDVDSKSSLLREFDVVYFFTTLGLGVFMSVWLIVINILARNSIDFSFVLIPFLVFLLFAIVSSMKIVPFRSVLYLKNRVDIMGKFLLTEKKDIDSFNLLMKQPIETLIKGYYGFEEIYVPQKSSLKEPVLINLVEKEVTLDFIDVDKRTLVKLILFHKRIEFEESNDEDGDWVIPFLIGAGAGALLLGRH